ARAGAGRLRGALPDPTPRGRAAGRRGRLPPLHVLARRQPGASRPPRRRRPRLRAAPRSLQRRRSPLRGVRPGGEAAGRELSPGVHPRLARQYRVQPPAGARAGGQAAGALTGAAYGRGTSSLTTSFTIETAAVRMAASAAPA